MGDTLRVVEVFNEYLRQDDGGHGGNVTPSLVTYNLVRKHEPLLWFLRWSVGLVVVSIRTKSYWFGGSDLLDVGALASRHAARVALRCRWVPPTLFSRRIMARIV